MNRYADQSDAQRSRGHDAQDAADVDACQAKRERADAEAREDPRSQRQRLEHERHQHGDVLRDEQNRPKRDGDEGDDERHARTRERVKSSGERIRDDTIRSGGTRGHRRQFYPRSAAEHCARSQPVQAR